jgi:ribonuclease Z
MHLMGRDKGLTIYGPIELQKILDTILEAGGGKFEFEISFVPLNGKDTKLIFEDNLIEIHTFPLKHRIPTNGFVIREKPKQRQILSEAIKNSGLKIEHLHYLKKGENVVDDLGNVYHFEEFTLAPKPSYSYAYCSDTVYWETIVQHIQNCTVLYHEATFVEKDLERARSTYHCTAKQAARIAVLADVNKLLLGHISARYENGEMHEKESKTIFPNSIVVEDGMKIIIS